MPAAENSGSSRKKKTPDPLGAGLLKGLAHSIDKVQKPVSRTPAGRAAADRAARQTGPDTNLGSDIARANAFKRTPDYKATVKHVKAVASQQAIAQAQQDLAKAIRFGKPKPSGGSKLASINVSKLADAAAGKVQQLAESASGSQFKIGGINVNGMNVAPKIVGNLVRDAIEIPAEAIPSLYQTFKPLAHGDVGQVASNLAAPFIETAKHPAKSFTEHPLGTLLLASGVEGGLARGAGRVGRSRVAPKAVQRAASLDRGTARLPGTSLVEKRQYSPDVLVKAGQVARDRRKTKQARQLRLQAAADRKIARDPAVPQAQREVAHQRSLEARQKAAKVDPGIITSERVLKRRANENVAANEGLRRLDRGAAAQATREALGRKPSPLVRPIAEGTVRATKDDVQRYIGELTGEWQRLQSEGLNSSHAKMAANEQLRTQLSKALAAKGTNFEKLLASANDFNKRRNAIDTELIKRNVIPKDQAERRRVLPAAVRHMGARYDPQTKTIRAQDGGQLPTAVVKKLLQADPKLASDPAFISQAPNARGAKNYYRSSDRGATIGKGQFTGSATHEGTYDANPAALEESMVKAQGLLSADTGHKNYLNEFGYRREGGGLQQFGNYKEAKSHADEMAKRGGPADMVPVRLNPLGARKEQLDDLLNDTHVDPETASLSIKEHLNAAFNPEGDNTGPWGLVPRVVAEQYQGHLKPASSMIKPLEKANSLFRRTVLATPKWVITNALENTMRGGIKGALPLVTQNYWVGRRLLNELPPAVRAEVMERGVGRGHMGFATRQHVHRELGQGTSRASRAVGAFKQTAASRKSVNAWERWNHLVFEQVNGRLESSFRVAGLGKYARTQLMDNRMVPLSKKAYEQAAQGLTHTHEQVALGRYVDDVFGKYDKFSPNERRIIALYTPFAAWTMNAARFLAMTLPKDHPVLTAVLVAASQSSQEWRNQEGLTGLGSQLPAFLQNSIPGKGGSHLLLSKYTPFSLANDPLGTLGGAAIPQFSGLIANAQGRKWTGQPLRNANGTPADTVTKGKAMITEAAGAYLPGLGLVQKATAPGGPGKMVNPFTWTKSKTGAGHGRVTSAPAPSSGLAPRPDPAEAAIDKVLRQMDAAQSGSNAAADAAIDKVLRQMDQAAP